MPASLVNRTPFWKKIRASARRKKKIACTTNVIESLWEKNGKMSCSPDSVEKNSWWPEIPPSRVKWSVPYNTAWCKSLICCGGNGRIVKAMFTNVNFPKTIWFIADISKHCFFSWHLVALSWEEAEGFYWKYSTMQSYKLCGHSGSTSSHFYVSRSLKELTLLCHGETFQCIKFLAFIAR